MDRFFGGGNLGQLFKRPAKVLDFCDKVIKSIAYRSANCLRAGSHSSSTNREDFENFSVTDSLAVQYFVNAKRPLSMLKQKSYKLLLKLNARRMLQTS